MIHIKHSVHICAQRIHGTEGDYYNYLLRFSLCGKRKNFSLGVTSPLYDWDPAGRCFAPGACDSDGARRVHECAQMLKEIVARYELVEQRIPTMDEVSQAFDRLRGVQRTPDASTHVSQLILLFIRKEGTLKGWSESTVDKFLTLRNHFDNFRPGLTIDQVDEALLVDMFLWFESDRGLRNTTLQKYSRNVLWFLHWCAKEGFYKGEAHETFHPKFAGVDEDEAKIVFLSVDELQRIIHFKAGKNQWHLEHIRDLFLFSCFSALRYSDVTSLTWAQVTDTHIVAVPYKTKATRLYIDLNAHTRALLDKYRGHEYPGGRVFPPISNQKANKYLHELCEVVGINQMTQDVYYKGIERIERVVPKYELVTFHAGRRSFITHALRLHMPLPVIMKFSGHKKVEMLKPYMAVVDELKASEMAKFDDM